MGNKNRKVWIITRRAGYNYGSSLQAYAIQQVVRNLGFKNEIINYDEYYHNIRWKFSPFIYNCIFKIMNLLPWMFRLIANNKYNWLISRDIQINKFKTFEKDNLILSKKRYKNSIDIAKDINDNDICICGSDQIWNPHLFDPVMFLDFCDHKQTKTIAYAPSFGVIKLDINIVNIKKLIQKIDFLSVREDTGASIIKNLIGREVPVLLDPTLLINSEDWKTLIAPTKRNEPYIMCYFLGNSLIPHQFIEALQIHTQYKIVNICTFRTINTIKGELVTTASPSEFLSYIANAAFICTDSFHGTIFSTIFERQFFTFERFGSGKENQNSRIYTLLNNCQLQHRLITLNTKNPKDFSLIAYDELRHSLEGKKKASFEYLKLSLNNS